MQHFVGLEGAPRRYYAFTAYDYLKNTRVENLMISLAALLLISGQLVFLVNFFWSLFRGRRATANPWQATTLEWTTSSPPPHGNFGDDTPLVHRWAYEYGAGDEGADFATQDVPPQRVPVTA
jgi:cytochrome c oxidase subunit 1